MINQRVTISKSHYQRKNSQNRVSCQQKLLKLDSLQKQPIKSIDNKENAKRPQNQMGKGFTNKKILILDRNINENSNNFALSGQMNENKSQHYKIQTLIEIKNKSKILPNIDKKNNQGRKFDNIEWVNRNEITNDSKIDQTINLQSLKNKKIQNFNRPIPQVRSDSANIRSSERSKSVIRSLMERRQNRNKFQITLTVTECYFNSFPEKDKQIVIEKFKTDAFCQTSITSQGDDYLLSQFNKFKSSNYKFINNYEQRFYEFHKICKQTDEFVKRNKQLIQYREGLNCQPREKRIHVLNDELIDHQNNFIQQLGIIKHFDQQKTHLISFMKQSFSQRYRKIQQLTKKLSPSNPIQLKQICEEVNQSVMQFCEDFTHFTKKFQQINTNLAKIQSTFYEWSIAINENRLLVYNCIKQIQKLPQMSIKMFGLGLQNKLGQKFKAQDQIQPFLNNECSKCFDTEKKVKYLHFQNNKIQPILKALDILLKGYNPKDNLFSPF